MPRKKKRSKPLHMPHPTGASQPNIEKQTSPSGRGIAPPAWVAGKYKQHYPIVPQPVPMSGQTGAPNSEFSVMASRFMQNSTMNQDDIDYFDRIKNDPPWAGTTRQHSYDSMPVTSHFSNPQGALSLEDPPDDSWRDIPSSEKPLGESLLREYLRMMLSESSVDYIAVKLNKESRDNLRRMFPPVHETIAADHVTLVHSPTAEALQLFQEGEPVHMRVVGYAEDDRGQAVAVMLPDDIQGVVSGKILHVTISTSRGTPLSYSNELLRQGIERTPSIVLHGRISFESNSY